ncbi:MAG: DUF4907 domain-containing protein [Parafilimonas sp.]
MKTKKNHAGTFFIAVAVLIANTAHTQQINNSAATCFNQIQNITTGNYTYKVFQAPNKMYGYDILSNGKFIFHQGASPALPNEFVIAFSKKWQAEKAALYSIKKLSENRSAALTREELKRIMAGQKQP